MLPDDKAKLDLWLATDEANKSDAQYELLHTIDFGARKLKYARVLSERLELTFEDGYVIGLRTYHDQDCCENVYADWDVLDACLASSSANLSEAEALQLCGLKDLGALLRFVNGDELIAPFTLPMHNEQNGYYNDAIDLVIDNSLRIDCTPFAKQEIY